MSAVPTPGATRRTAALDSEQLTLIGRADTLFLGTAHPTGGADASHPGGSPGFVHAGRTEVCWPDCSGNNMFNSLGNLAIEGSAAVLFLDSRATTLHVNGTAEVHWDVPGARRAAPAAGPAAGPGRGQRDATPASGRGRGRAAPSPLAADSGN